MKTLGIIGMVPLVLIAATAFSQGDNRAVPRSGGGGGGGSSAGSRHTGGSSSGSSSGSSADSSSHSGGNSGSSAQGSGSRSNDSTSGAAQRRPRPGTGTGTRDRYGNDYGHYYGYPYSNYYYNPYYSYSGGYPGRYGLYGYGYGYYDYGYSYGDYYGYYPQSYNRPYGYRRGNTGGNIAQLRILVEPVKARVYVDGYYAGIVDDFDGLTQRLNVSPGRHDITFKLEGYTSHTFATNVNSDQTLKLRFDMVKGGGETRDSIGEAYDRRPEPDQDRDSDTARYAPPSSTDRNREVDSVRADRLYTAPSRETERGELLLEIEPADASVYVDGEFYGKASQVTRLELSAGRHRIEVVRPGHRTEETEVEVDGDAKRVTVKLDRR